MWCAAKNREKKNKKKRTNSFDDRDAVINDVLIDVNRSKQRPVTPTASVGVPEVSVHGLESYTLMIQKSAEGFGFTVYGSSPVQIGRFDEGSPAAQAGLRLNDCIIRINGQNVSRSTADSVARIVRESEKFLILEVQRLPPSSSSLSSSSFRSHRLSYNNWPAAQTVGTDARLSTDLSAHHSLLLPPSVSTQCHRLSNPNGARSRHHLTPLGNSLESNERKVMSMQRYCQTDLDQTYESVHPRLLRQPCSDAWSNGNIQKSWSFRQKTSTPIAVNKIDKSLNNYYPTQLQKYANIARGTCDDNKENCLHEERLRTSRPEQRGIPVKRSSSDVSHRNQLGSEDVNYKSNEDQQWLAVQRLIACEESFVLHMQLGVQQYLRPLKSNSLLQPGDHENVFQNIATIMSISEDHVRELHTRRVWRPMNSFPIGRHDQSGRIPISSLASVYNSNIDELCLEYEHYCLGTSKALQIVNSLRDRIGMFLRASPAECGRLTLSAFLQKPFQHLTDLISALQKVLNLLSSRSDEFELLQTVTEKLKKSYQLIRHGDQALLSSNTLSLSSGIDCERSLSVSSSSSGHTAPLGTSFNPNTAPLATNFNNDTELNDIQSRLVFPASITWFPVAESSRHLIYCGSLQLVDSKDSSANCTIQVHCVLLSDLILLTRPEPDSNALNVIHRPIMFNNIVGCNFSCQNACEFVISIETPLTDLRDTWEPLVVTLRAPSTELKHTWMSIIEQRIIVCKSQRHVSCRMSSPMDI